MTWLPALISLALAACGGSARPPAASSAAPASVAAPASASANPAASANAASAKPSVAASKPAASGPAAASAAASPAVSGEMIRMSWPVVTTAMTQLWIANDKGLFAKHGVNVDLQYIAPQAASQALVGHNIDVYAGGPEGINIRANGGDVKYFGSLSPLIPSPFGLYGHKGGPASVTSDADIAGKTIAATNREAQTDVWVRELLYQRKLDASKAKFVYTQQLPASLAGLETNQFDLAVLGSPIIFQVKSNPNVTTVVEPGTTPEVKISGVSFMAYTTWIKAHEPQAKAILEAVKEAGDFSRANPEETQQIMGKYLKVDDKTLLQELWASEKDAYGRPNQTVDKDAFTVALRYSSNPGAKSETADDLIYEDNKIAKSMS